MAPRIDRNLCNRKSNTDLRRTGRIRHRTNEAIRKKIANGTTNRIDGFYVNNRKRRKNAKQWSIWEGDHFYRQNQCLSNFFIEIAALWHLLDKRMRFFFFGNTFNQYIFTLYTVISRLHSTDSLDTAVLYQSVQLAYHQIIIQMTKLP